MYLARKLLLNGIVIYISDPLMQVLSGMLICFIAVCLQQILRPYLAFSDNAIQNVLVLQLFFTMFSALLVHLHNEALDGPPSLEEDAVIEGLGLFIILTNAIALVSSFYLVMREAAMDTQQELRRLHDQAEADAAHVRAHDYASARRLQLKAQTEHDLKHMSESAPRCHSPVVLRGNQFTCSFIGDAQLELLKAQRMIPIPTRVCSPQRRLPCRPTQRISDCASPRRFAAAYPARG